MVLLLFIVAHVVQTVQGSSSNSTDSNFPQPVGDGTVRSVWSILGSCALTLLICIWHSIHFNLPLPSRVSLVGLGLLSFFAPEVVVLYASAEWWVAREKVIRFHEKGYAWSMKHSFFAEMGGFVYRDDEGNLRPVNSLEFLELCEANKIANPAITVKEIRALSKSDTLGKAILALQLLWFTLQVVVRGSFGLAVTLVELDTVSMAALALFALWFWWEKPLRPECPHIFYSPQEVKVDPKMDSVLNDAWKSEPTFLDKLMARFISAPKARPIADDEITLVGSDEKSVHSKTERLMAKIDEEDIQLFSLCATWLLLGGLHLIAWNFGFPTEKEKIIWRVASLVLTAGPVIAFASFATFNYSSLDGDEVENVLAGFGLIVFFIGIVTRMLLVGLMLASLRALPPSAYQTVSWTAYIPHL